MPDSPFCLIQKDEPIPFRIFILNQYFTIDVILFETSGPTFVSLRQWNVKTFLFSQFSLLAKQPRVLSLQFQGLNYAKECKPLKDIFISEGCS